jgi:hypothetical protein
MGRFKRYAKPNVTKQEYDAKAFKGVDFDGVLATKTHDFTPGSVGEPIWPMINRVKQWLTDGENVKIFTARCSIEDQNEKDASLEAIRNFCRQHIGQELDITCTKSIFMTEYWDDRAVHVEPNTGRILSPGYESEQVAV